MLKYDPDGPARIIGVLPAPDWPTLIEGLRERIDIGRVDGTSANMPRVLVDLLTTETIEEILSEVGGWDNIVATAQRTRVRCPKMWGYIENPPAVLNNAQEDMVWRVKSLLFEGLFHKKA